MNEEGGEENMNHYHKWETLPMTYNKGDRLAMWMEQCKRCGKVRVVTIYDGKIVNIKEVSRWVKQS
jgi:hypothetical protein